MGIADFTQRLKKPWLWRTAIHVAGDRLDDDAGDSLSPLRKHLTNLCGIVEVQGQRLFGQCGRHSG